MPSRMGRARPSGERVPSGKMITLKPSLTRSPTRSREARTSVVRPKGMAPKISPKKSWEGYFAGIFTSVLVGAYFAYAFSAMGPQPLAGFITPVQGALLGLVIGGLAPLGDLGESMFKRQSGTDHVATIAATENANALAIDPIQRFQILALTLLKNGVIGQG